MHRGRRALPWAVMLATWGLAVWACRGDAIPDGDDVLTGLLALAASVWAIVDFYYLRGRDERAAMKAEALEHDAVVAAEGVAAYIRQETDGKAGRDRPANPRLAAGGSAPRRQ